MGDIVIARPDTSELAHESHVLVEAARSLTVASPDDCHDAAAMMRGCKALEKRISDHCRPSIDMAHKLHKQLVSDEKTLLAVPQEAYRTVDSKVRAYRTAEEEQRRRAEAIVEAERRREAEEARLAEAAAAEEWGDDAEAERLLAAPVQVQPVVLPTAVPRMEGVSYVTTWKARVTDERQVPRDYLIVDMQKLGAMARASKGTLVIPGVEFYSEESPRTRA